MVSNILKNDANIPLQHTDNIDTIISTFFIDNDARYAKLFKAELWTYGEAMRQGISYVGNGGFRFVKYYQAKKVEVKDKVFWFFRTTVQSKKPSFKQWSGQLVLIKQLKRDIRAARNAEKAARIEERKAKRQAKIAAKLAQVPAVAEPIPQVENQVSTIQPTT